MLHRCKTALLCAALALADTAAAASPPAQLWFDDFSYLAAQELAQGGWIVRTAAGHPGVPGANWSAEAVSLLDDPDQRGNRLLRLAARTDGTPAGTTQAQLCHARKYLEGTYAARVRFRDQPSSGADGDPVVQTFYAVSPLRFDFDPEFSEIDWEYLPNGGWGSERTRLYGITWQTVRVEPWQAHNQSHEEFASVDGWHLLVMQVAGGRTRHYLDGRLLAEHGGRNYPVVPMTVSFNLWFSPGGLMAPSAEPRLYEQDVDWVFHARAQVLSPQQVMRQVQALRKRGVSRLDDVPAAEPPLPSRCDF
jgi:hypothetical protein